MLTVAALCVYVTYTINLSIDSQKNNAVSQIDSYVTNKNNAATNMINELAGSASKIENMRKYMELLLLSILTILTANGRKIGSVPTLEII